MIDVSMECRAPMMSERAVMALVREYLEREFLYMRPVFVLGDDDGLLATGVIDSMGVLEVIVFLEVTFQVTVADNQITAANLGTIRAIAQFVERAWQAVR